MDIFTTSQSKHGPPRFDPEFGRIEKRYMDGGYYAPIRQGISSISGIIERGTERESRHRGRMATLGLAGRQMKMQEEGLGLERRLKGLQIGELERLELERKTEEARLLEPANLKDINRIVEYAGPAPGGQDPVEYWGPRFAGVISKDKYLYEDPDNPERLTGFSVKKGEVSGIWNQVKAGLHPTDLVGREAIIDRHIAWLYDKGATETGKNKRSAQLRKQLREKKEVTTRIQAGIESPMAYLAANKMFYGTTGTGNKDYEKLADEYLKAVVEAKGGHDKLIRAQIGKIDSQIQATRNHVNRARLALAKVMSENPMYVDAYRRYQLKGGERMSEKDIWAAKELASLIFPYQEEVSRLERQVQSLYGYKAALGGMMPKGFLPGETAQPPSASGARKELGLSGKESPKPSTSLKKVQGKVLQRKTPEERRVAVKERQRKAFGGIRTRGKQQVKQSLADVARTIRETVRQPEAGAAPWYVK